MVILWEPVLEALAEVMGSGTTTEQAGIFLSAMILTVLIICVAGLLREHAPLPCSMVSLFGIIMFGIIGWVPVILAIIVAFISAVMTGLLVRQAGGGN